VTETARLGEERRRAARLAARAEIRDVRMLKSDIQLIQQPESRLQLRYTLDADVNVEYQQGDSSFVVRVAYDLTIDQLLADDTSTEVSEEARPEGDETSVPRVATLHFELAALFTLEMRDGDDPVKDEELEAYAASTGQLALYPYAREYVYDVTGRLGLPPLTMGVLQEAIGQPD
jgi:hypothetical protein